MYSLKILMSLRELRKDASAISDINKKKSHPIKTWTPMPLPPAYKKFAQLVMSRLLVVFKDGAKHID